MIELLEHINRYFSNGGIFVTVMAMFVMTLLLPAYRGWQIVAAKKEKMPEHLDSMAVGYIIIRIFIGLNVLALGILNLFVAVQPVPTWNFWQRVFVLLIAFTSCFIYRDFLKIVTIVQYSPDEGVRQ